MSLGKTPKKFKLEFLLSKFQPRTTIIEMETVHEIFQASDVQTHKTLRALRSSYRKKLRE